MSKAQPEWLDEQCPQAVVDSDWGHNMSGAVIGNLFYDRCRDCGRVSIWEYVSGDEES